MTSRTPLMRFLRALLTLPAIVAGAVTALYLLLLGWGMLMQVRWLSDRTRQLTKRANPYLLKIAGTRTGIMQYSIPVRVPAILSKYGFARLVSWRVRSLSHLTCISIPQPSKRDTGPSQRRPRWQAASKAHVGNALTAFCSSWCDLLLTSGQNCMPGPVSPSRIRAPTFAQTAGD